MTLRERILAVLNYQSYDKLPIIHFGFWDETLEKWHQEGHLSKKESTEWADSNEIDYEISKKLGFDANWHCFCNTIAGPYPPFERKVIRELEDGSRHVLTDYGAIVLEKDETGSIPAEIDHTLKDRKSWEEHYLPRLQFTPERVENAIVRTGSESLTFKDGGLDALKNPDGEFLRGIHCGSLFGQIRNWVGVEQISYLYMDDEALYTEIVDTVGELCFQITKYVLESGAKIDHAHFWEDICFKSGPLVIPSVFDKKVGPHYKRITELLSENGVTIISLDCDGLIDSLIPTWLNNGVNTMFPIEVGTWHASIGPWREKYGKEIRGVGGMDKKVFAHDFAAIDKEIERLKPLVELGGYIPCPDHRIPPDATWDNVRYYCDKMRKTFG